MPAKYDVGWHRVSYVNPDIPSRSSRSSSRSHDIAGRIADMDAVREQRERRARNALVWIGTTALIAYCLYEAGWIAWIVFQMLGENGNC